MKKNHSSCLYHPTHNRHPGIKHPETTKTMENDTLIDSLLQGNYLFHCFHLYLPLDVFHQNLSQTGLPHQKNVPVQEPDHFHTDKPIQVSNRSPNVNFPDSSETSDHW